MIKIEDLLKWQNQPLAELGEHKGLDRRMARLFCEGGWRGEEHELPTSHFRVNAAIDCYGNFTLHPV
jgi:hypothetical protein